MVSPVFCFGAPAFWKKSLADLKLSDPDIRFLGSVSVIAGVLFLIGLLLFFLAKHMRPSSAATPQSGETQLLDVSLILNFVAFGLLMFVCLEISYLTFRNA